jgi:hypothetical protein
MSSGDYTNIRKMKNMYTTPNHNNRLDIYVKCNDEQNKCSTPQSFCNEVIYDNHPRIEYIRNEPRIEYIINEKKIDCGCVKNVCEKNVCENNENNVIYNYETSSRTIKKYLLSPNEGGSITFTIKKNLVNFINKQVVSVYYNITNEDGINNYFEGYIYKYDNDSGEISINNIFNISGDFGNSQYYNITLLGFNPNLEKLNNRTDNLYNLLFPKNLFNNEYYDPNLESQIIKNTRLFINNDVSLNKNLQVNGTLTVNGQIIGNGGGSGGGGGGGGGSGNNGTFETLYVNSDASFNGDILGFGAIFGNNLGSIGNLIVGTDINLTGNLNLNVQPEVELEEPTKSFINGDLNLGEESSINLGTNSLINGNLNLGPDSSINLGENSLINGNLKLGEESSINLGTNSLINGISDLQVSSNLTVGNEISLTGNLNLLQPVVSEDGGEQTKSFIVGNLNLSEESSIILGANSSIYLGTNSSIIGNLNIGPDLLLTGRLDVGLDASFNGNLEVVGEILNDSDYRIKKNVTLLDETYNVDNLKPVIYDNILTNKKNIGLIAHELAEHYPLLVNGEKNGENYQSVNYIGLIGVLINEIQQIKKKLAEQDNIIQYWKEK